MPTGPSIVLPLEGCCAAALLLAGCMVESSLIEQQEPIPQAPALGEPQGIPVEPPDPLGVIAVDPPVVDLGSRDLGTLWASQVRVINEGQGPLVLTGWDLEREDEDLSVVPPDGLDAGSLVLEPGWDEVFTVTYSPTSCEADPGSLLVRSNDQDRPQVSIPIQAWGLCQVRLYPTGVDDEGVPLPGGSVDPHYQILRADGTEVDAIVLSTANRWYEWPHPEDARWLYDADAPDSGLREWITFRTTFDLTGYDPSTAELTALWAADQWGSIRLNGVDTDVSLPDGSWKHLNPLTLRSGFVEGENVLEILVKMVDGGDGLVLSEPVLSASPR